MQNLQTKKIEESTFIHWFRRGLVSLLVGVLAFEALNYAHVLGYHLDFTWFGRVFSTSFVLLTLIGLDWLFRRKLQTRLPPIIWVLCVLILGLDFCGDVFGFYGRWEHYDQVAHFFSGPSLTICLVMAYRCIVLKRGWQLPTSAIYLLALGTDSLFAVAYELEEYLEDVFFDSHRLGDGPDTANDLMMNLLGALLTLMVLTLYTRYKRSKSRDVLNQDFSYDSKN